MHQSHIPQYINPISHNTPFCNRNVHISVTKWCIVGCLSDALWDLLDGSIGWPPGGGGVLGQVLDRDAQRRPSTWNATRVKKKGGVETIHFAQFWWKIGVEIWYFLIFPKIVETIQIFQRPEIGGSKWWSICSNLHIVSAPPGWPLYNQTA